MDITYRDTRVGTVTYGTDPSTTPAALKGFDLVTLGIPLRFHLEGRAVDQRWTLSGFNVELLSRMPGTQNRLLGSGAHTGTVMPATGTNTFPLLVYVRCSPRALLQYETARNGTAVNLRCDLRSTIYGLLQMNGRECLSDPSLLCGTIDFEFPQHTWASMLRSCDLSASVFVEIPLPSTNAAQLDDGHRALLDAFAAFENGGPTAWKDSIGHVRPYLEAWNKQQPLPNALPPKDGSNADREWKLLNLRDALYKCCHPLVHNPKSSCTRKDALLILNTFACLLDVRP
jgi:hypothetical protein